MTMRSLLIPAAAVATAVALVACGMDASTGTGGAMGQSSATPDCAPNDSNCLEDGLDAPVAVGARLPVDVRITAKGVSSPKMTLEPARSDVLAVEGGALVGKSPGWSSVLFVNDEGLVMDFLTLNVTPAERVEMYRLTPAGGVEASPLPEKIQLAEGDDFEIAVKAFSGATRLLGELDATWTLDQDIATMLDTGRPASRRLRVKAPGTANLTIDAGGFTKTIALEVLP
jgi:hypothetical protein